MSLSSYLALWAYLLQTVLAEGMPTRQGNWLHKHSGAHLALHLFAKGIFLEISYVGWFGAETLRWPIFPLLYGSVDRSVYR